VLTWFQPVPRDGNDTGVIGGKRQSLYRGIMGSEEIINPFVLFLMNTSTGAGPDKHITFSAEASGSINGPLCEFFWILYKATGLPSF
jgi:hypothetical protein